MKLIPTYHHYSFPEDTEIFLKKGRLCKTPNSRLYQANSFFYNLDAIDNGFILNTYKN